MATKEFLNKIHTKDWLYLFIISFFLQFIIYYFSFIYGGSVKALGYISFAGTLISIILAVIAIGYTYGESIKQKGSSDQLLLEIAGLREIKDKLAGQVDILENIADLKVVVEDTKNAVSKFDLSKDLKVLMSSLENEDKSSIKTDMEIEKIEQLLLKFSVVTDSRMMEIISILENEDINNFDDFYVAFNDKKYDRETRLKLFLMYLSHFQIGLSIGIFEDWGVREGIKDIYSKKYPRDSDRFQKDDSFTILCNQVLHS
ncbi:hypothetical protein [Acinetobacter bereziniae]|uniref:hypothetical protein n=1 Tax=Acinetobacter bereziniae TaxID=106648 RepID=UPI003570F219